MLALLPPFIKPVPVNGIVPAAFISFHVILDKEKEETVSVLRVPAEDDCTVVVPDGPDIVRLDIVQFVCKLIVVVDAPEVSDVIAPTV